MLAESYRSTSNLLKDIDGRRAEALEYSEKDLKIREELCRKDPENLLYKLKFTKSYIRLLELLCEKNEPGYDLNHYCEKVITMSAELLEADPGNADYKQLQEDANEIVRKIEA